MSSNLHEFSARLAVVCMLLMAAVAFSHSAHAASPIQPNGEPVMQYNNAPLVGSLVMTKGLATANGTDRHPAVVTRDWQPETGTLSAGKTGMVNLSVIADTAHHVVPQTSVTLYASEAEGDAATAKNDHVRNGEVVKARPRFAYVNSLPAPAPERYDDLGAVLGASVLG